MLAIIILLVCWGLFAVGLGVAVLATIILIDEAWNKIKLGLEHKNE